MKNTDKVFVNIMAVVALLLAAVLAVYFLTDIEALDGTWNHTYFPGSILFFCILSLIIFFFKQKIEDNQSRLRGKPFIKSQIDWAEEYKKHLTGRYADIPFSPTSGISICTCELCFFRTGPQNPKKDCQIADNSAKKFFGWPIETILPEIIDGKEVGNYCPHWTDMNAE